jgi:hypothetical protein
MTIPRLEMDFNGVRLENMSTKADMNRQGIAPYAGMRAFFYQADREGDSDGYLCGMGTVIWNEKLNRFDVCMDKWPPDFVSCPHKPGGPDYNP